MSTDGRVALAPTGHEVLFTHAVLWGAGAIAAAVTDDVRLGWTSGLAPAPLLLGIGPDALGQAVHELAARACEPSHWIQAGLPHEPQRGLFSPRVKALPATAWSAWQQARSAHLDRLTDQGAPLDLKLIAGLGEPSSWHEYKREPRQDDAASRLELQPRNQGSEFVGTRLRPLAAAVAARDPDQVVGGLTGATQVDEVSADRPDSRSAANLRPPSSTDNALAWVAMWGLASLPVVQKVARASRTPTHLPFDRNDGPPGEVRAGHVVVPLWRGSWTMGRLRAVLVSRALSEVGKSARFSADMGLEREQQWLIERGVTGVVVMPIHTFGSTSSPERRVMSGRAVRLTVNGR